MWWFNTDSKAVEVAWFFQGCFHDCNGRLILSLLDNASQNHLQLYKHKSCRLCWGRCLTDVTSDVQHLEVSRTHTCTPPRLATCLYSAPSCSSAASLVIPCVFRVVCNLRGRSHLAVLRQEINLTSKLPRDTCCSCPRSGTGCTHHNNTGS